MTPTVTKATPHDPLFIKIETLLSLGDEKAALALWNEALDEQFESGVSYSAENIGEGHREN